MGLRFLEALFCLSVSIIAVNTAEVSTRDTLVTSRYDAKTTESVTSWMTDKPIPPIKLTDMIVESKISLRYARTTVFARVMNPAIKAQEANFRVLLPETAFITGFVMTIGDKPYKAYVKEKEEAQQIYDQAVSQGIGAAHITATARDSNQFVVSANVEPIEYAIFNLTYEELLVRRNGVYNHAINLHPGEVVPNLSVIVHIIEAQRITDLRVPAVRTGNEIDASKDDAQNLIAVIQRGLGDREAKITFTPNHDEQKELMDIYAVKSMSSIQSSNNKKKSMTQGVLGQFVVQYDVDRPQHGEILVNDGYFVHFFAPSSLPPLNKYVVFVLDTSGSMKDRKIEQLLEAMNAILTDLNTGDFFSIVEFASSVTVHSLKEADQGPPKRGYDYEKNYFEKEPLVPPSPASQENIAKAKDIISRLSASGGTNIIDALDTAVNLIQKRWKWGKKCRQATHNSSSEETTAEIIDPALEDIERMKTLEPIIIFLTDGAPTVGVTSPNTIINKTTEKNSGQDKASIFSLAFGESANRDLLRGLSLSNDGFMRHIYEAADAALQLHDFYRQVSSPLLADVKFVYPENQVKGETVTKKSFRTFFAGSEVVVAGQVSPHVVEFTPQVIAFCGLDNGFGKKIYKELSETHVPAQKEELLPLERLWSYLTIKQLLDEKDVVDDCRHHCSNDNKANETTKKVLALALKYEFVTPLTSLVVVKPNATNIFTNVEPVNAVTMSTRIDDDTLSVDALSIPAPAPDAVASLYHLEDIPWIGPLINSTTDVIKIYNNGTVVQLKLTKDLNIPINPDGDSSCAVAVGGGGPGVCVYITRCSYAKSMSSDDYSGSYCFVNDGYAGVCCSPAHVDEKSR